MTYPSFSVSKVSNGYLISLCGFEGEWDMAQIVATTPGGVRVALDDFLAKVDPDEAEAQREG